MAFDTLRSNKMRSALTVLGVVIGVTSIVGMTSLIRGFDTSLRDSINSLGPKTIFVQSFGAVSFSSGASFIELMRRPNLTVDDSRRSSGWRRRSSMVDIWLGAGPPPADAGAHVLPRRANPAAAAIMGTSERFVDVNFAKMLAGRVVHRAGGAARAGASR